MGGEEEGDLWEEREEEEEEEDAGLKWHWGGRKEKGLVRLKG